MLSVRVVGVRRRRLRRRQCRRHIFRFRSITFEGMYWFHSNFEELYTFCITIKYRSNFDVGNHPPVCGWAIALFRLSFCCSFPLNNFWRDSLISFKLCRTYYHCKIQVKFNIGNHPPVFVWVMALFRLSFCCSFPLNDFWRDALILFKLRRTLYRCKIQVKFDIGIHPPYFGWLGPFST